MSVYIHQFATQVPNNYYTQDYLRDRMKEFMDLDKARQRFIHRIYSHSGIDKRHSVIDDFDKNGEARLFFQQNGQLTMPSTGTRNAMYTKHAKPMYSRLAECLLEGQPRFEPEDITHVITVSCTGFFAPEPAYHIVKTLGLPHSTKRFHIGFMGCFAAFPALKMAKSFCQNDPDAVVMIVCLELCSLHFQSSTNTDSLISASVFADGGAGVIVSAEQPAKRTPAYRLDQFSTTIAKESEQDMSWTIGDTGFEMVLSTYVPGIIQSNIKQSVAPLLDDYRIGLQDVGHWAIHPGGRAILDKVRDGLNLEDDQLKASRDILAKYGNMSSATVFFVLDRILKTAGSDSEQPVLAMAFGPGLTIESGLLTKITG